MLSVIILSVVILSVIMLNVVILSVIMLNVVASIINRLKKRQSSTLKEI
jgi:hypothetical protein